MASPRVLIVNNVTKSLNQLRERFTGFGADVEVADVSGLPSRVDGRYQAMVLSGTKVRAFDTGYYRPLVDLVMNSGVPVLGICGGMQILGVAAGAFLKEGEQRVGGYKVNLDPGEPLFAFAGQTVTLFQRHTLYLTEAPAGYRVIGRSENAPVEFLRSDDGRVFGSQAHLEFRDDGAKILRGFAQILQ